KSFILERSPDVTQTIDFEVSLHAPIDGVAMLRNKYLSEGYFRFKQIMGFI
ncbi:hypothetical protein L9F63_020437, partial [Diploptera punctata]